MVKYAPRKVYIRESGGYVELSYTEFCRCRESDQTYMDKLFIPIQGCLLEVVREQYTDFYRDKERWRYLQKLQEITYRAMMGEFIIYYRGKIVGGIYDDRLLVKPTKSAISYMPTVTYEIPYENAKEMLLVEEVDNKDFLTGLFDVMYDELPTPKPKKKK